jgi:hypothetical protein
MVSNNHQVTGKFKYRATAGGGFEYDKHAIWLKEPH